MVEQNTPQPIKCQAAVAFEAKKPMTVVDIWVAPPKAGEVRVKVLANALCHTDIYTLSGADPEGKFPSILGHEATAVVESVGEGVTEYKPGDLVIPCYTPECKQWDCIFCQSQQTNLCPRIRGTQGKSVMPDGTTRFTLCSDNSEIFHFMGCSTFSEYTVLADISLAKINPQADPYQVCLVGCGVSTGWGAVMNNPNWRAGCSVAVWGLGAVGLAVTQAAALMGATRIYGMDVNPGKFEIAKKQFGVTECFNPLDGNAKDWLLSKEKWGIDFTYDCTGLVPVMRDALESAHRGFGESMVIGVAAAGKELATRPFQLITGRQWKGTAFGGWKSRQDVPKLVNKIMLGELPIKDFITHNFVGLKEVQALVDALHSGNCLRGVLKIADQAAAQAPEAKIIASTRLFGGVLKTVQHESKTLGCTMKFSIFLPEDMVHKQRRPKPYAQIYYLSGLTCNHENAIQKSGFAKYAKKHNLVMIFPDTSPRGLDFAEVNENKDYKIGYGAGHYCNATAAPWNKNFNMFDYVTEELPGFVADFFPVDPNARSVMGHSMGGNGALVVAMKSAGWTSCSAFAPIADPTTSGFCTDVVPKYFGGDATAAEQYSSTLVIKAKIAAGVAPKDVICPTLCDTGTSDSFENLLNTPLLRDTAAANGLNLQFRMQEGYDHSYNFISTFMEEHIDFHATYLKVAQ